MVPDVERSGPATCETPLHAFFRTTIAPASHAICDMRATNVEIMRKSCRGEDRRPQSVPGVAGSVEQSVARLQERPPGGVAVGFGGRGDVLAKERGEVTLVGASDLETDLAEGHVSRGQQPLRPLHPARGHVSVGRQPGRALEQARKMGGARLRHSGELGQGEPLLQMGLDIGDRTPQLGRRQPAGHHVQGLPRDGIASEEVDHECIGQ